jgi:alpha-glucosidase
MTSPAPILLHHQVRPFLEWRHLRPWVQLWVAADLDQREVWMRLEPDNEELLVPMTETAPRGQFRVFDAPLTLNTDVDHTVYAFKVLCADRQWWLDAAGVTPRMPLRERFFRLANQESTPDWVPDQTFYQIFPERFRNGDPSLGPHDNAYQMRDEGPVRAKAWGEPIDPRRPNSEFYGGDLVGVRDGLDYLTDLGVTALYLNPIFTSPSVHKYDIEDFEHVDPYLGGDQALADLRTATSERGMRLVLDAVFNHCSDTHPWFNRWDTHPQPGAYASADAPYRDAFIFHDAEDPDSYHCWQGCKVLPVLDFANPKVQDYFYAGRQCHRTALAATSLCGRRLALRRHPHDGRRHRRRQQRLARARYCAAAREENPDAYILGEHFFEATRWLQGDQEDGAMNYYGFAHPLRAFLAGKDVNYHPVSIDAGDLDQWLTDARSRIPYANQLCQLNLLGSHDTSRFLTLLGEDLALMRIALLLQFTYPGVPCIYYGDEIGMTAENDPYNRACFDWNPERWDLNLRDFVRNLARLRQAHPRCGVVPIRP